MNDSHETMQQYRRGADQRYVQTVITAIEEEVLPSEAKLRTICSDAGKSFAQFEADLGRGRERRVALAKLLEAMELSEQSPLLTEALATQRQALADLRRRHETELREAERAMNNADVSYADHLERISDLRREGERTLVDTCSPALRSELKKVTEQIFTVSQRLAVKRLDARSSLPDPRPDVQEAQALRKEAVAAEVSELTSQLESLQVARSQLEEKIISGDVAVIFGGAG